MREGEGGGGLVRARTPVMGFPENGWIRREANFILIKEVYKRSVEDRLIRVPYAFFFTWLSPEGSDS